MSITQESIKIQDFQSVLRKCLNCKQLELVDLLATNLLPLGENYCSTIVKLDATFRRTRDGNVEKLYLVAKMKNPCERPIVFWNDVFIKELFMYAELIPAYKRLETEAGIKPVLDVLPKYIGCRYSLSGRMDLIDEHSMLLMENLKMRGFYTCERRVGLDLEHAKKALVPLARYHSLGIAMKQKRPDFFKIAIAQAQNLGVDFPQLDEGFDAIVKTFHETPSLSKHLSIIESSFSDAKNGGINKWKSQEPWITIIHGDFWVNNILFHKDKNGRVDDVKFVDFQTYLYNSPLKDLPYFICGSLDEQTKANHVDELLSLYHQTLVESLERLGCDTKLFTKEAFDFEMKQQAIQMLPLCALAIKFFVFDTKEGLDNNTIMTEVFKSQSTDAYIKKLQEIISLFETRGWF